jgi:hypothetical protein
MDNKYHIRCLTATAMAAGGRPEERAKMVAVADMPDM